jgi:UDP-glucose 4-epimerase
MFVALTGTKDGFSDYDKYIETNQITLLNVLSAYVKQKSKARLVFPSSRLVYKGIKDKFLKEDSVKETNTVYAVNKLACEAYLKCWGNAFDVSYTIYRICVPFGQLLPGNYSYGTLGFMTRQAKQNALISLYGDGKQKRTFTHVADICEILGRFSFLKESQNLTINIGSNDNIDMNTLANMLATKFKAQVTHKPWPEMDFKIESGDTMFDDSLLQSLQHFEYKGTLANFLNG